MLRIKSFQRRLLLALLGVGLLPAVILLAVGARVLVQGVDLVGTAGPWAQVGESGQRLLAGLDSAGVDDPAVREAARAHREALSESLRISRVFGVVADRLLGLLPLVLLGVAVLVAALAYWAARLLSRGFGRPIRELVGWTDLIARGRPLPPPGPDDTDGVREFSQLREALRRMAGELEESRREAVHAAKLRSWTEMARRIAHELKNPLTPMRMAATTAARSDEERTRTAAVVLLEEIDRLEEMARTFSQFGKMPEGPPAEVDVADLLRELVNRHEEEDGPVLDLRPPPSPASVRGHYDALLRAFRNLLLNAMDASGSRGRVEIEVTRDAPHLVVEIRDTGPGIPPESRNRIWEPDFTTKSRGTGLGLPMVRQVIRAHGGEVEGRNLPEGGAVFRVALPPDGPGGRDGDPDPE
jgi:signal transduction histidine kinase